MKPFRLSLMLVLPAIMWACSTATNSPAESGSSPAQDSIRTFITNYYDAMSRRNWPEYRGFFWEKATLTTVWQPPGQTNPALMVITIDDFIRQTPDGPDSKPIFEERLAAPPDIRLEGNLASVWARYNARFGTEDDLLRWSGTDVFTLMKFEGEWKIVSLAYE